VGGAERKKKGMEWSRIEKKGTKRGGPKEEVKKQGARRKRSWEIDGEGTKGLWKKGQVPGRQKRDSIYKENISKKKLWSAGGSSNGKAA